MKCVCGQEFSGNFCPACGRKAETINPGNQNNPINQYNEYNQYNPNNPSSQNQPTDTSTINTRDFSNDNAQDNTTKQSGKVWNSLESFSKALIKIRHRGLFIGCIFVAILCLLNGSIISPILCIIGAFLTSPKMEKKYPIKYFLFMIIAIVCIVMAIELATTDSETTGEEVYQDTNYTDYNYDDYDYDDSTNYNADTVNCDGWEVQIPSAYVTEDVLGNVKVICSATICNASSTEKNFQSYFLFSLDNDGITEDAYSDYDFTDIAPGVTFETELIFTFPSNANRDLSKMIFKSDGEEIFYFTSE